MFDRLAIKTPCNAPWEEMVGDDSIRFCCTCSKNVYDLSAMEPEEAATFLELHLRVAHEEGGPPPCVRIFRRPDGRILTSECGPGHRNRHVRRAAAVITAGLAATVLAGVGLLQVTRPTLSDDAPAWLDDPPADQLMTHSVVLGGISTIGEVEVGEVDGEVDEHPIVRIDEGALAEKEEPESELLGTAKRTTHVAAESRASKESDVLSGFVHLVTPPVDRF